MKYVISFSKNAIATLNSLIKDKDDLETLLYYEIFFLLDTKNKNLPIFFTMQIESSSSQPFGPLFRLLQLNERDANQKSSDAIIRQGLHLLISK